MIYVFFPVRCQNANFTPSLPLCGTFSKYPRNTWRQRSSRKERDKFPATTDRHTRFHCREALNTWHWWIVFRIFYQGISPLHPKYKPLISCGFLWQVWRQTEIHNFQARVNLLPIVTDHGLAGVGVSPKIIHAQGSPELEGKLEMFYGLGEDCFKMLGPGGTLFLQEDPGHLLRKNILQAKWLLQGMAPWADTSQHASDFPDSHLSITEAF